MNSQEQEILTRTLYFEGGQQVIITYPESIIEEVNGDIEKFAKSGGLWYAEDWIGLTATLNGSRISFINMSKFIGME